MHLSLYRNKIETVKSTSYGWSSLTNRNINNKYTVTVRNKFDTLQKKSKTHTLSDKYENFVTAHMEATAECIPSKPRAKCTVSIGKNEIT